MTTKSSPFSLRLSEELDAFITEEARRTRRSKGAVISRFVEEARRMQLFPGIAFVGEDWDRRAWVIGTGLEVWEIVWIYQDFGAIEPIVENYSLTEQHIRLALAYYTCFPEEIDSLTAYNRRPLEDWIAEYPSIEVIRISE